MYYHNGICLYLFYPIIKNLTESKNYQKCLISSSFYILVFLASFPVEWRVNETFLSVFQTLYHHHHHRDMCSRCSRYRKGHWKCSSYNMYDLMSAAFCNRISKNYVTLWTFFDKGFVEFFQSRFKKIETMSIILLKMKR